MRFLRGDGTKAANRANNPGINSLLRENDCRRRRSRGKGYGLESRFGEPGSIVGLTSRVPALRHEQHLRREHHGEGMSRMIVVEDEIVDHKRPSRFQCLAEFSENCDVVLRRFHMGDVSEDRIVVLAEVEIACTQCGLFPSRTTIRHKLAVRISPYIELRPPKTRHTAVERA